MQQSTGTFDEWTMSAVHPLPRPLKLSAYVDAAEAESGSASAMASLFIAGCGVAALGVNPMLSLFRGKPAVEFLSAPPLSRPAPLSPTGVAKADTDDRAATDLAPHRLLAKPERATSRVIASGKAARIAGRQTAPLAAGRMRATVSIDRDPLPRADRSMSGSSTVIVRSLADVAANVVDGGAPSASAADMTIETAAGITAPPIVLHDELPVVTPDPVLAVTPDARTISGGVEPSMLAEVGEPDRYAGAAPPDPKNDTPRQTARGVEFAVNTSFNGIAAGRLSLLLADSTMGRPDQVSDNISVRLGDLVTLLGARMSPALLDWMQSSRQVERYVTLNDLRAHGIAVSFDDNDRLVFRAM